MSYQDGRYEERIECKSVPTWVPLTEQELGELEKFSSGVPTFDEMVAQSLLRDPPYAPGTEFPGFISVTPSPPPLPDVPAPAAAVVLLTGAAFIAALIAGSRRTR